MMFYGMHLLAVFVGVFVIKVKALEDEYSSYVSAMHWNDSEFTCQSFTRTLVNIKSQEEQTAVGNFLDNLQGPDGNIWIGLRKMEPDNNTDTNSFVWTDGSIAEFTNWGDGQPNLRSNITQRCVFCHSKSRKWYTSSCNYKKVNQFICQKQTRKVQPILPVSEDYIVRIIQKTGHAKIYKQRSGQEIKAFTIADGTLSIQGMIQNEYIKHGKVEDCIALCQRTPNCTRYAYTRFGTRREEAPSGVSYCRMYPR